MDKSRAFCVATPWYGFLAGAHIPELLAATSNDTFGLRQRLTICFGRPPFQNIGAIRDACSRLPIASNKPHDYMAALLCPLLRWATTREHPATYTLCAAVGAQDEVDRYFDHHQETPA